VYSNVKVNFTPSLKDKKKEKVEDHKVEEEAKEDR
jgi:hypothetical protein